MESCIIGSIRIKITGSDFLPPLSGNIPVGINGTITKISVKNALK